jgi:hypothetical protein
VEHAQISPVSLDARGLPFADVGLRAERSGE